MIALARYLPSRRHLALTSIALLGGVVGGTTLRIQPSEASSASVLIPPTEAASLIAATSGDQLVSSRAVGDQAKLINAAMPFSHAPILAARQ